MFTLLYLWTLVYFTAASQTISRPNGGTFDTLMCLPGTQMNVTDVRTTSCTTTQLQDCSAGEAVLMQIKQKCDGGLSCRELKAPDMALQIYYDCLAAQATSAIKCPNKTLDMADLTCPVNTEIQILSVYAGVVGNESRGCESEVGDCVGLRNDGDVFRKNCNGRRNCGKFEVQMAHVLCRDQWTRSNYIIVLYDCIQVISEVLANVSNPSLVINVTTLNPLRFRSAYIAETIGTIAESSNIPSSENIYITVVSVLAVLAVAALLLGLARTQRRSTKEQSSCGTSHLRCRDGLVENETIRTVFGEMSRPPSQNLDIGSQIWSVATFRCLHEVNDRKEVTHDGPDTVEHFGQPEDGSYLLNDRYKDKAFHTVNSDTHTVTSSAEQVNMCNEVDMLNDETILVENKLYDTSTYIGVS